MPGVSIFCMQALYLASFYFSESKEPRETRVIKLSQKTKYSTVLQLMLNVFVRYHQGNKLFCNEVFLSMNKKSIATIADFTLASIL